LLVQVLSVVCVAVAVFAALVPERAEASTAVLPGFSAQDRVELERMRQSLRRARPAQADSIGYALAVFVLDHMPPHEPTTPRNLKEAETALREACAKLPARTLAAVGSAAPHPIVSDAFCQALLREKAPVGGHGGVAPQSEVTAEASEALRRFGVTYGKSLLEFAKEPESPAMGAGGVTSSVYGIVAFVPRAADTGAAAGAVVAGLRAGIEAGAGTWASRFRIRVVLTDTSELGAARDVDRALDRAGVGVMVVTGGTTVHAAATARAFGQGLVLVDARSPADCDPGETGEFPPESDVGLGLERTQRRAEPWRLPTYSPQLDYTQQSAVNSQRPLRPSALPPLQMRPPGTERGRRLAEVLRSRADVRRVAIALPEDGGDLPLVTGFAAALRAVGREIVVLEYAPGRRAFTAEAMRFAESGAQAILLAGPGEESGEWLAALAARNSRPLVLGSNELEPSGLHPSARTRLEGAVFVGDDWVDQRGELERRFRQMDPGPDRISGGRGADYRRGYRAGWLLARSISEGAFTASSLALVLARHSLEVPTNSRLLFPVRSSGTAFVTKPEEVVVPLYTVKNGEAIPLSGF